MCLSNDFLQNTTEFTCSQQICSTMLLVTKVSTGFRNYCFFGHYLCFLYYELSVHMGGWHCAVNTSWNLLPFSRNMTLKSICHPSWYIPCRRRCPYYHIHLSSYLLACLFSLPPTWCLTADQWSWQFYIVGPPAELIWAQLDVSLGGNTGWSVPSSGYMSLFFPIETNAKSQPGNSRLHAKLPFGFNKNCALTFISPLM